MFIQNELNIWVKWVNDIQIVRAPPKQWQRANIKHTTCVTLFHAYIKYQSYKISIHDVIIY